MTMATAFADQGRKFGAGIKALALLEYMWRPRSAMGWVFRSLGVGVLQKRLRPTGNVAGRSAGAPGRTRCGDLMTEDVVVVGTGQSVRDAARIMQEMNVGFVPVCQSDHTVLGTITDRDLALRVVAEDKAATATVQDVMSSDLVSVHPDDDISVAEERMLERRVNRILVVQDDGRLAGVISLSDLTRTRDEGRVGHLASVIAERQTRH